MKYIKLFTINTGLSLLVAFIFSMAFQSLNFTDMLVPVLSTSVLMIFGLNIIPDWMKDKTGIPKRRETLN